jgi:hypothetical protein
VNIKSSPLSLHQHSDRILASINSTSSLNWCLLPYHSLGFSKNNIFAHTRDSTAKCNFNMILQLVRAGPEKFVQKPMSSNAIAYTLSALKCSQIPNARLNIHKSQPFPFQLCPSRKSLRFGTIRGCNWARSVIAARRTQESASRSECNISLEVKVVNGELNNLPHMI